MYKMISSTTEALAPDHVNNRMTAAVIPGERQLQPARVSAILAMVMSGTFCRAMFAYVFCKETGQTYGCNGRHTGVALTKILSDTTGQMPPFPAGIPTVIERWECDTKNELAHIFDTYDNPLSARGPADKLGVFIAQHDDLNTIPAKSVKMAVTGVNTLRGIVKDPELPKLSAREAGMLLADETVREYCLFINSLVGSSYDGFAKAPINAAVYESWTFDRTATEVLCEELFGENAGPSDVSRKFATTMRTSVGKKGRNPNWFYQKFRAYLRKGVKRLNNGKPSSAA